MSTTTWTIRHVLVLLGLLCLLVALIVALGATFVHNWQAWTTAGLALFFAAHLPWRGAW